MSASPAAAGSNQPHSTPNPFQQAYSTLSRTAAAACSTAGAWAREQNDMATAWVGTPEAQALGKEWWKNARCLAVIAPFAAVGGGTSDMFLLLTKSVCQFVKLYLLLLFVRCAFCH